MAAVRDFDPVQLALDQGVGTMVWSPLGWGRLTGELTALAASLPAPVRDALGIRSPSRVFAELGRQLPAGMAVGIEGGTDRVRSAVNDMVAVPSLAQSAGMRGRSGPLVEQLHIHVGEGGEG